MKATTQTTPCDRAADSVIDWLCGEIQGPFVAMSCEHWDAVTSFIDGNADFRRELRSRISAATAADELLVAAKRIVELEQVGRIGTDGFGSSSTLHDYNALARAVAKAEGGR